jgi:hypothetical protein
VSFSNTSSSTRPSDSCYFEVFEKLTRACYIQIALETMLLPVQTAVQNSVTTVQEYHVAAVQKSVTTRSAWWKNNAILNQPISFKQFSRCASKQNKPGGRAT